MGKLLTVLELDLAGDRNVCFVQKLKMFFLNSTIVCYSFFLSRP